MRVLRLEYMDMGMGIIIPLQDEDTACSRTRLHNAVQTLPRHHPHP